MTTLSILCVGNPLFEKYQKVKSPNEQDLFIWLLSQEDIYCIEKVENLKDAASDIQDTKAAYYAGIYSALQERFSKPIKQFKNYLLALLRDKDSGKIIEAIAKVDKSHEKVAPTANGHFHYTPLPRPRPLMQQYGPFQGPLVPPPSPTRMPLRRRFCTYCKQPNHCWSHCRCHLG